MLSIALNLGGRIGSAFLNTLAEKASSYTLQHGQRSDLHDEVHWLRGSLIAATAVLQLAERKQQRNKDDEELLRELLLQLKDAAYDAEDLFGDLDYQVLRQKVADMQNEASHDIPSSSISFAAANSSNSGDHDFAAIFHWTIDKTVLLKQSFAQILPSFHLNLSIHRSEESVWFDEGDDQEWLQILTSLRTLEFVGCSNLRSLPTWFHRLTSLQYLSDTSNVKKAARREARSIAGPPFTFAEIKWSAGAVGDANELRTN